MRAIAALVCLAVFGSSCGGGGEEPAYTVVREDSSDVPIAGATPEDVEIFLRGDALFNVSFREAQGLGPVFVRSSCKACHTEAARGPGDVTRMSVVEADGLTQAADQRALPWGNLARPQFTAGASRGVTAPLDARDVVVSRRVGPAVFGRGWIEAVADSEIERLEREQSLRDGSVSGRIHRLPDGRIGRFGLKARIATLQEFTADALLSEMGMTSSLLPTELPNPDGLVDDLRPGVDVDDETLRSITGYVQRLAIPRREGLTDAGRVLFDRVGCSDCHVAHLRTRADYPVAALANAEAWIYSDLLLHDMGTWLADGLVEGAATEREWRTSPLIGMRFSRSFMHDGRARTLDEAIRMHWSPGSEAIRSVNLFNVLSPAERRTLIEFVRGL